MNRLRELRKERNLTIKGLSKVLGVSDKTLYRWETQGGMKPLYAKSVAEHLGVNADYLMGRSDIKSIKLEEQKLPKNREYTLLFHETLVNLMRDANIMTAQELNDIKRVVRNLYDELVLMQYEAEKKELKNE
jgi:transcriptional regulator with XRE-family HTH domain